MAIFTVGAGGIYADWAAVLADAATVAGNTIQLLEDQNFSSGSANMSSIGGSSGTPTIIRGDVGSTRYGFVFTGSGTYVNINDDFIDFRYLIVSSVNNHGFVVFNNDINWLECEIKDCAVSQKAAISIQGTAAHSRLTIDNCDIHDNNRGIALLVNGATLTYEDITIKNSNIYNQADSGVRFTTETGGLDSRINNFILDNNHIFDNGGQGFRIATTNEADINSDTTIWSTGLVVINNTVNGNGTYGGSASGILYAGSDGGIIYNNTSYDNWVNGALIGGTRNKNITVERNICYGSKSANDIDGAGIFLDRFTHDSRVIGNTVYNCPGVSGVENSGQGIAVFRADGNLIAGNDIYNCKHGATFGGTETDTNIFTLNTVDGCSDRGVFCRSTEPTNAATSVTIKENVIINNQIGIESDWVTDPSTVDLNTLFGNTTATQDITATNTDTSDPLLSSDRTFPSNSPVIGQAIPAWTGANPTSSSGEPYSNIDTDRGHIQSTFSPFHPTNL